MELRQMSKGELINVIHNQDTKIESLAFKIAVKEQIENDQIKRFSDLLKNIEAKKGFWKFLAWVEAAKELISFIYQIVERSKLKNT